MEETIFREALGSSPKMIILEQFITWGSVDHSKQEIIQETGLARATVFHQWQSLEVQGIILKRRRGKRKSYYLNPKNPVGIKLCELFDLLIKQEIKRIKKKNIITGL